VGSGPMEIRLDHQNQQTNSLELHRFEAYSGSRNVPEHLSLHGFASFNELKLALESGEVNFALLERHHQLRLQNLEQLSSTPLRDRWVGVLIFNAAGRLQDRDLRLALFQQMQLAAQDAFGSDFSAHFYLRIY